MDDSTDSVLSQLLVEVEACGLGTTTWQSLIAQLEKRINLEETARAQGAFKRWREVRSASDLLRLVLVYAGCDWSLREVGIWGTVLGLAALSKVAVRQRLLNCGAWLAQLIRALLIPATSPWADLRIRLLDTTTVTGPGTRGTDWRLHTSWDLGTLSMTDVEMTPTGQNDAETLGRFPLRHDEIVLADQGFSYAASLVPLLAGNYPFVVRSNWRSIRLEWEDGSRVEVVALMRTLAARQILERPVWVCHEGQRYRVRLIIGALPQAQADRARQRVHERLRKRGKTPTAETLLTAGCTLLLTNLPLVDWPAERVLAVYRWRWHIEVYFKRLKSLLHLDQVRARTPDLQRVYLLAKLLIALLVDQEVRAVQSAYPAWFHSSHRPVCMSALTHLFFHTFQHLLIGPLTPLRILLALLKLERYLRESPRKRAPLLICALQSLAQFPAVTSTWMA